MGNTEHMPGRYLLPGVTIKGVTDVSSDLDHLNFKAVRGWCAGILGEYT